MCVNLLKFKIENLIIIFKFYSLGLNLNLFHTSFKNSFVIFCELCKHFKATFRLKDDLTYVSVFLSYVNGPSFQIAEYTVAKPPLPISLISLNRLYGIHSNIISRGLSIFNCIS